MRYWDASALVSLCVAEETTVVARRLAREPILTWSVSAVEIASAIERRARERTISPSNRTKARAALTELAASWTEVSAWPQEHDFVCTDQRLCDAAAREGFHVLPERE